MLNSLAKTPCRNICVDLLISVWICSFPLGDCPFAETSFKVVVHYRGKKVMEELVTNEAGFRLAYR